MKPWTCVVLTCTNAEWAAVLRTELDVFRKQGFLHTETCFVVEDPGADVGSGGATLNALLVAVERLCNLKGYTTVSTDVLLNSDILLVHQGRTSCYWPMGKAFFPIPAPNRQQSGLQTYLEYIVDLCSKIREGASPGIWVASTDTMLSGKLLGTPDWKAVNQHGTLFTVKSTRRHSRFCGSVIQRDGIVQSLTYENSCGHDDGLTEVVGGILYLKPQLCEALLSLHTIPPLDCATYLGVDSGELPLKVSLYFDLLSPLCKGILPEEYISGSYSENYCKVLGLANHGTPRHMRARTVLWDTLKNFTLGSFCLPGLCQRYWTDNLAFEELLDLKELADAMKDTNVLHSGPLAKLHFLNSFVNIEIPADQNPVVCIHSSISGPKSSSLVCQGPAYFLNCHIDLDQTGEFAVPGNAVFVGYNISVRNAVQSAVAVFSATDIPLLSFKDSHATVFGIPWPQFFARKGISQHDLWDDEDGTLFTARLYPLPECRTDWRNLLWLCTAESTAADTVRLHSWRTSPRYSLKDFVQLSSPAAYFRDTRESVISAVTSSLTQWQGSFLPYFRKACAEGWADRMLQGLDTCASSSIDPARVSRFLAAIADLLGCIAGDEGGLRSGPASNIQWADAFYLLEFSTMEEGVEALARQRKHWMGNAERLVRAARHYERAVQIVIRNTVKSVKRLMPSSLDQRRRPDFDVWLESCCPARIDLSGGWSDTPPICYEMGGSVVNLAILVDGKRPIGSKARRMREPVLVLRHDETCEPLVIDSLDEALNYTNPLALGALMKASLVCAGVLQPAGNLQDQLIKTLGGGLELQCWSCLPKGSGLGTSSIMAATLLAVIYSAMGVSFTRSSLIHGVLYVEQLLTTGGGWQDQVSGVVGGANRGHSPASPSVCVGVEKIPLSRSTVDALNSHLILLHTGKVRLARNLLQNVIRNWYARDESTVTCFRQLVRNSFDCAESLTKGDLARLGRCVDTYWKQKKILAPGCEPAVVAELMEAMKPYVYGQSLTEAGGGGFYFAIAREPIEKHAIEKTIAAITEGANLSAHQVEVDEEGITLQINGQYVNIV